MKTAKRSLSVNLDHIATLRQTRHTKYPDPVFAAGLCALAGADGITLHLRSDRRHIQERDVELIRETSSIPVTVEMACDDDTISIIKRILPDAVTLVPERPEELTTEGGLNLRFMRDRVATVVRDLKGAGIHVCLFLEPDLSDIEIAREIGCDSVEIHTGAYAHHFESRRVDLANAELERFREAARTGERIGLQMNAGHGLHYENIAPLAAIPQFSEFSIGHAIVARSIFTGLAEAVREMKRAMSN
jgi:pyridoxine 5-phosphate synthase